MREREPVTQTMKSSDARRQWSQLLNWVFHEKTRVIVEKSGVPVAAIISPEDFARLKQLDMQVEERWQVLDEIHARNGGVTPKGGLDVVDAVNADGEEALARLERTVQQVLDETGMSEDELSDLFNLNVPVPDAPIRRLESSKAHAPGR